MRPSFFFHKFVGSLAFSVVLLFIACGEESTRVVHDPLSVVETFAELDSCSDENTGDRALVKADSTIYVCVDAKWVATVERSDEVAISLDTLSGYIQKGPFLKGSMVYLYELSDGHTLKQTNGNFMSVITGDDGRYRFSSRDLKSQYAMLVVEGKYRNEVTGEPTTTPIQLQAYTNMLMRKSANVNLLTHLEKERVYYLVTHEKLSVRGAKKQAQAEILSQFYIDTLSFKAESEDLDVFGKNDADAALLAVSILLQGDSNETALSVLLTEIVADMAEDGEWNGANANATKTRIADWAMAADTSGRLAIFRKNVKSWGLSDTVPEFEKHVRRYWTKQYGFEDCDKKSEGEVVATENELSDSYGTKTRFVCKDGAWKTASDLEKDTYQWKLGAKDGESRLGDVTRRTYFYDKEKEAWHKASNVEIALGFCSKNIETDKSKRYGKVDSSWYLCKNREWSGVDEFMLDTLDAKCSSKTVGKKIDGAVVKKNQYYCTAKGWVNLMDWNWDVPKEARFNPDIKYDSMIDPRDNKVYKIVTIGTGEKAQTWMAENLNYADSVATPSLKGRNWCFDNVEAHCDVGGRLYSWSAAIDSVRLATDENHPMRCGELNVCNLSGRVQGICPEGWHLPRYAEVVAMTELVGDVELGSAYITQTGWNGGKGGTDIVGLSMLPTGFYHSAGKFGLDGVLASVWMSTEDDENDAFLISISANSTDEGVSFVNMYYSKSCGMSVRCIQDRD